MIRTDGTLIGRSVRLVLIAAALPAGIVVGGLAGFRINFTPSEPLGLWRIQRLDRPVIVGDVVFICPPKTAGMQAAYGRGYLRSGLCSGGYAPLIKTIAAVPGQRVEIGHGVSIDGVDLAHSALARVDGKGRRLEPALGGVIPEGEVLLHSDFFGSFDSRYFGPVPISGILGLADQVLTYAP